MNTQPVQIEICGDLSSAVCDRTARILAEKGVKAAVSYQPWSDSEPFGLEDTIISLAGAIAGIVSCVVGILQLRGQGKTAKKEDYEERCDAGLRNIGDRTYERIGNIEMQNDPCVVETVEAEEFSLMLRDVATGRRLIVSVRHLRQIVVIDANKVLSELEK